MGPLAAAGAILVPAERLKDLEIAVEGLCKSTGFHMEDPRRSEFKWSPGRDLWVYTNLVRLSRERFFLEVVELLTAASVKVIVIIEDTGYSVTNIPDIGEATPTRHFAVWRVWAKISVSTANLISLAAPSRGLFALLAVFRCY